MKIDATKHPLRKVVKRSVGIYGWTMVDTLECDHEYSDLESEDWEIKIKRRRCVDCPPYVK